MGPSASCQPIIGNVLCTTPAEAVARFLHEGCADNSGRTMAIAAFTLSLWQVTHGPITASVPSVLLVNAGDDATAGDPIDAFVGEFVFPGVRRLEEFLNGDDGKRTLACPGDPGAAMNEAFQIAELARSQGIPGLADANRALFHHHRSTLHGDGPAYRYARAWSDKHGWFSGDDSRMILRLHAADDYKAFRKDLLERAEKLRDPQGYDHLLRRVRKHLSLSGSLTGAEWDRKLVDAIMNESWPMVFLPHCAKSALEIPYSPDLHLARMQVAATGWQRQVTAERMLPDDPWVQHYHQELMKRLAHMPLDYSFNIQRIIRELGGVCMRLASVIGQQGGPNAITLIGQDLFRSTLRAMVIGVASLAYHGWGFDAGVPRARVLQLLEHLRANGPQSRRALQRKFPLWLKAGKRDALLERLSDLGLVYCPDDVVSAVPLPEYIRWLHRRPEFPAEGCLSSLLLGQKCRPAGPLPGPPVKRKRRRKPKVAVKLEEEKSTGEPNDPGESQEAA
jgi:hypothetical protein